MAVVGMRRFWLGKAMPAVLAAALCVWCVPASALADVGEGAALADAALADPADNALADGELPADASAALAGDAVIESTEGLGGESDPDAVSEGGSDLAVAAVAPSAPGDAPAGEASLSASLSADERAASVVASGGAFALASSVSFPAWSEAGGQDDIAWYAASRRADGSWVAEVPVSAHRSAGAYAVHAYATVAGVQAFAGEASFEVSAPRAEVSVTQTAEQRAAGRFTVEARVDPASCPSGVASVQLPAWSDEGGQDDVVWHGAELGADGVWRAESSALAHRGSLGAYAAHAYVTCGNGVFAFAGAGAGEVSAGEASLSASLSADERAASVVASGGAFALASSVSFPAWSEAGGQDDIAWYAASRRADGSWVAEVPVSAHRSAGAYAVHAYATVAGVQAFAGEASFEVSAPRAEVSVTQTAEQRAAGRFTVEARVDPASCPSGVASVQLPAWSDEGGQDDVVWHGAELGADGVWRAESSALAHRGSLGAYAAHAYVTCGNGVFAFAGAGAGEVSAGEASLSASLSADERAASVVASGGAFALASSVSFPAWSEAGGQDDIAWYAASRRADGSWVAEVPVSAHRSAGAYAVHAYATVAGVQAFAGEASFEVSAPRAEVSVTQTAEQRAAGRFTVEARVDPASCPSGVASVQVPAWSDAGGQDDVVWHAASRQADGTYRAVVSAADHGCGDGAYTAHAYVTGGNGVMACVGGASASLELRDYVAVTGAQGSGSRTVWVKNPAGGASSVQVPTWSEAGGQDDIVWYQAAYQGDGLWKCVVDCRNFRSAGTCVSHVYADGRCVGGVSYSVTDAEILLMHNIPYAGQPNGYYCGPTAGYMVLQYLGANASASGTPLNVWNVASYMGTTTAGTTASGFTGGMNGWLGYHAYTSIWYPSYDTVRNSIMNSFTTGYPTVIQVYERRGGPHYNGHANVNLGHFMVVDGYNPATDAVYIADPWAGVWSAASPKFWYGSLREFTATYITPYRGIYTH